MRTICAGGRPFGEALFAARRMGRNAKGAFKRKMTALLLVMALPLALPVTAYADIGPKPSVQITFTGIEGEIYYGTLLSEQRSTGPSSAWDGSPGHARYENGDGGYEIWKKFVDYQDPDGFCFLQEWWDCSETNSLRWTYRPPSTYKILLYFPESDSFLASPVYERYAFDSYYTADLSGRPSPLMAEQSYDFTWEAISLAARVVLTILLELAVALLFGYREKRLFRLIAAVNIVTQAVLNVALNIVNYYSGSMAYTLSYILFECIVAAIEAVAFVMLLKRFGGPGQKKGRMVFYALAANGLSFGLGLWLSHLIPGIF